MGVLWDAVSSAFGLLARGDRQVLEVLSLTLRVSLTATAVAVAFGVPLGAAVGLGRFPGRRIALALLNTGMGLPPLVVGLVVTVLLWRSGPLGSAGLLYSPTAIVIAQTLIAFPLVAGISAAALQQVDPEFRIQMEGLGASRLRSLWEVAVEARLPLVAAVMAGLGAAISEVGAALVVGGNIEGETRVLTTAAVLETSKGNFDVALAYGFILLTVALAVNVLLTAVQQRGQRQP